MNKYLIAALATGASIVALATPAYAQPVSFDIPAGSLARALDAFARQSGRQILYRADDVKSARSPGVRGAMAPELALDAILTGTGFAIHGDRSGAVAIVRGDNPSPRPHASAAPGESMSNESLAVVEPIATNSNRKAGIAA